MKRVLHILFRLIHIIEDVGPQFKILLDRERAKNQARLSEIGMTSSVAVNSAVLCKSLPIVAAAPEKG